MSILQRLSNLWRLSGIKFDYPLSQEQLEKHISLDDPGIQRLNIRKMSQIIKMKTPVDKFLDKKTNE